MIRFCNRVGGTTDESERLPRLAPTLFRSFLFPLCLPILERLWGMLCKCTEKKGKEEKNAKKITKIFDNRVFCVKYTTIDENLLFKNLRAGKIGSFYGARGPIEKCYDKISGEIGVMRKLSVIPWKPRSINLQNSPSIVSLIYLFVP